MRDFCASSRQVHLWMKLLVSAFDHHDPLMVRGSKRSYADFDSSVRRMESQHTTFLPVCMIGALQNTKITKQ
jgi:hypothetical protein